MLTPRSYRLAARVLLSAMLPFCTLALTPDATTPAPAIPDAPAEAAADTPADDAPVAAPEAAQQADEPSLPPATVSDALALVTANPADPLSPTPEPQKRTPAAPLLTIPPFSDYEIILLRKPFGSPPPIPEQPVVVDNSALLQEQEEQKLAKQINMVAVNKTPSGRTAVGFIDKSDKTERNYYLNVGDSANGYTVVEASYENETATLTKDGVTITLKLGQGLVKGGNAPAEAPPQPPTARLPPGLPVSPVPHSAVSMQPPALPSPASTVPRTLTSESFRERLYRQRAEREAAGAANQQRAALDAQALAEKITKEELEKGKREININLIRQGMNPLSPTTLTPEEDAEMVKLGVLQAQ